MDHSALVALAAGDAPHGTLHAPVVDHMLDQLEATYLLGEVLGRGGMGIVYAATLRSLDLRVAVKLPHPELMHDAFVANRFRIEGLAGARVDHKNLARVLDFGGGDDGAPYIVMEFISGKRLDILLNEAGALDTGMAVDLMSQILAALEAAHSARIIHADIKTGNVLVDTLCDGVLLARVIDFGLAHFLDDPSELDVRVLSGTPDYLAPELVRGGVPSVASDIYAAGVVLYELLTGTTPFGGGTSSEIMNRHVADDVVPPSLRCPDQHIPAAVEAATMRALAKKPSDRFATAAEFAAALQGTQFAANTLPRHLARGTMPIAAFSAEATTRSWLRERATVSLAAGEPSGATGTADGKRAVETALATGDADMIVTAYLELTRVLIDRRELEIAATELTQGLTILRDKDFVHRTPMWRLQLCLAAVYSGLGDRSRANQAAILGREDAGRAASTLGEHRANGLIARLARSRSA